jgi:excisionase family DNA binding protein
MDKLYSVEEAAERLGGISTWTLHAWLSKKRLQRTKVGSRTMIRESELERFLEACNQPIPETNISEPSVKGVASK